MKILIIEDEKPAARLLKRKIEKLGLQVDILLHSVEESLQWFKNNAHPDLIFLDIQLSDGLSFEIFEQIDIKSAVIFTTAFDEYAIKAFEEHAVDYLLKPFTKERFNKAVQKWMDQRQVAEPKQNTKQLIDNIQNSSLRNERVVVKTGTKIKIIPVNDILFLAADDDYVKIHTPEGSFLKNKTMAYFEKLLGEEDFVRVHRSYIVRINEITRIDPYEKESHLAILKSGEKIPVSKTGYPKLRQVLGL